jgi:hypothetical protein
MKNSTDSIVGVDRRGDRYWKDVAAEYNLSMPQRSKKNSYSIEKPLEQDYTFNYQVQCIYEKSKREHGSGESNDQVMERAHAEYKGDTKKRGLLH